MPSTRRSTRLTSSQEASPGKQSESPGSAAGTKRKSDPGSSPVAKRGKKSAPKQQTTIEESMDIDQPEVSNSETTKNGDNDQSKDTSAQDKEQDKPSTPKDAPSQAQSQPQPQQNGNSTKTEVSQQSAKEADAAPAKQNGQDASNNSSNPSKQTPEVKDDKSDDTVPQSSKMDGTGTIKSAEDPKSDEQPATNGGSAVEAHDRDDETPASILEKGLIYFFFKGRVGIDNPSDVGDIARSYIILRPIPHGAKIGEGPIGSGDGKCRLLALPKKVLPISGKDKFMTFVESAKTTFSELKDSFLSASDYETKTAGVRHTPSATPIAEGVYAITTTGRESHLAYMLTIPQELGDVQKDIGLRESGSFVTSAKNPQYAGPANTNLPQGPDFPKEILDEFRSLRWSPLQPKHLDYENAQFLLIGESSGIDKALEPQGQDSEGSKGEMKEEMEKLEGEDEIRIKHLKGDDSIFTDLGVSRKDYSLQTTWDG